MPGWAGSTRRRRLPPGWATLRATILDRDGHACTWIRQDTGERCGLPATDVDHIIRGDDHTPGNLRALCHWHHLRKSGAEGGTASQAARARTKTPKRAHPGLID